MPVTAGHTPAPEDLPGASWDWEPGLRAVVDLVLASPVAMALAVGDDLTLVYNDAYAELLGPRHPGAYGRPAADVFPDSWLPGGAGPVMQRLLRSGRPGRDSGDDGEAALPVRGMSAVRDGIGRLAAVLVVAAELVEVTHQLQRLSTLSAALAGTLTLDDVARVALRHAHALADVDQVAFAVDDGPGWRAVRRIRGELLDDADERLPPVWRRLPGGSPAPLAVAAATGQASFVADGEPLRGTALDRHDEKVRAMAALPLRTESLRGALTFGHRGRRGWTPGERALLTAAAELVAQAAERARRFETQHGTSQLLQRSMLPQHLPESRRFRLAARYEAGVDGNAAGGDFYDAFALPGDRLGIVLGDVAGHDVRAAALMGQIRAALRALALADPEPAGVLRGLDRLVSSLAAESRSDELFVTVVYAVVEADGRLDVSTAGHPPPLIRRPAARPVGPAPRPQTEQAVPRASTYYLDVPSGAPLGLGGPRHTASARLAPGETLLMFSDGVVERRGHDVGEGLATVARAVAAAANGDPRTLCALTTAAVGGATEDDVAVLAVEHAVTPSRSAGMEIPAEPTAPGRVRRWMAAQLAAWRVPDPVIGNAVLCASELATNALLHAGTAARIEVDLSPERLLVAVSDSGTRGGVARAYTERLSSRGRGLGLIEELSDAWGTDPAVRGSTVWFEMSIPHDASEPSRAGNTVP
jgi:anti-sigma regulatory factor (Ser/Thr protein kinase)